MTINLQEVGKFADLAKDWWNPNGAMKPLHAVNFPRSLFIDCHIPLVGKKLLDIGCGGGLFTEAMAERGALVTGIDPSEELIKTARRHAQEKKLKINYYAGTSDWLLKKRRQRESYDLVSCLEVLEHTGQAG